MRYVYLGNYAKVDFTDEEFAKLDKKYFEFSNDSKLLFKDDKLYLGFMLNNGVIVYAPEELFHTELDND